MLTDSQRLFRYVERWFANAKTHVDMWPTVRRIARAFRWTQQRVVEAIEDDERLFTTTYFTSPELPIGQHFVESTGDEEPLNG